VKRPFFCYLVGVIGTESRIHKTAGSGFGRRRRPQGEAQDAPSQIFSLPRSHNCGRSQLQGAAFFVDWSDVMELNHKFTNRRERFEPPSQARWTRRVKHRDVRAKSSHS
jgi:hypothetical protein